MDGYTRSTGCWAEETHTAEGGWKEVNEATVWVLGRWLGMCCSRGWWTASFSCMRDSQILGGDDLRALAAVRAVAAVPKAYWARAKKLVRLPRVAVSAEEEEEPEESDQQAKAGMEQVVKGEGEEEVLEDGALEMEDDEEEEEEEEGSEEEDNEEDKDVDNAKKEDTDEGMLGMQEAKAGVAPKPSRNTSATRRAAGGKGKGYAQPVYQKHSESALCRHKKMWSLLAVLGVRTALSLSLPTRRVARVLETKKRKDSRIVSQIDTADTTDNNDDGRRRKIRTFATVGGRGFISGTNTSWSTARSTASRTVHIENMHRPSPKSSGHDGKGNVDGYIPCAGISRKRKEGGIPTPDDVCCKKKHKA